jgi:glucan phosphoethanolaminetransferase (alkaline phosphatase superfamily)
MGEQRALRKLYLRSLVVLAALVCYYFGFSLIDVPQEKEWTFIILVFVGYIVLGFVFSSLFSKEILTSFASVFVLGFLGAMLSIVSYGVLFSHDTLSRTVQDFASFLIASFFIGAVVATGASASALLAWIIRRCSGKGKRQGKRQTIGENS